MWVSQELVAGTAAGIFGVIPWYPIDTLKSRMQTRQAEAGGRISVLFMNMIKQEGFFSLYRGLLSPTLGYGLINGSVFGAREMTAKFLLDGSSRKLHFWEECVVGASAGFWSSFVRAPVERVKTVMQVRNREKVLAPYSNSLLCAKDLIKTHGLREGLYVGFGATVMREVPQYVLYFFTYARVKTFIEHLSDKPADGSEAVDGGAARRWVESLDLSPATLKSFSPIIAGGAAGAMCWMPPLYSIDVIKTRLQSSPKGTYSGFLDCVAKSYKAEGPMVFVRGLSLAFTRAFLVHGSIFFCYENCLSLMRNNERDDPAIKRVIAEKAEQLPHNKAHALKRRNSKLD